LILELNIDEGTEMTKRCGEEPHSNVITISTDALLHLGTIRRCNHLLYMLVHFSDAIYFNMRLLIVA